VGRRHAGEGRRLHLDRLLRPAARRMRRRSGRALAR
jgi:hypothetical protein